MKLVYTNENRVLVSNAKNIVEASGIEVELRNEYAAGAAGDLSPLDTWMELWVCDDRDHDRARKLIDAAFGSDNEPDWFCVTCKETNASSFELCWNCGGDRPQ